MSNSKYSYETSESCIKQQFIVWLPVNMTQSKHVCSCVTQSDDKKNRCVGLPASTCLSEVTMTTAEFLLCPRLSWLGRASNFALLSHFSDLHRRLSSTHRVLLILTFPAPLYHLPVWFLTAAGDQSGFYFPRLSAPQRRIRRPRHVLVPSLPRGTRSQAMPSFYAARFSIFILFWKHPFSLLGSTLMLGQRFQVTFCDKNDHMGDANRDL